MVTAQERFYPPQVDGGEFVIDGELNEVIKNNCRSF